jgi:hypothetical protein
MTKLQRQEGREQSPGPLLTSREAAEWLGLSEPTLRRWRCEGVGPRFLKFRAAVRYRLDDLVAFAGAGWHSSHEARAAHRRELLSVAR